MTATKKWEPALYLDTDEARQAYLEEALSDANGDPSEVLRALGVVAVAPAEVRRQFEAMPRP